MRHFELVAILSPMLNQEEAASAWNDIKSFISNRAGEITGEQLWGTRRLAYPIRKGNFNFLEGAYYLSSFTVENAFNRELETYLRLDDRVLRSLVMRCDGPLEDKPAPGPLTAPSRYIPPGRGPRRGDGGGPIPEGAGGFAGRGPRPPMGAPGFGGPPPGPAAAPPGSPVAPASPTSPTAAPAAPMSAPPPADMPAPTPQPTAPADDAPAAAPADDAPAAAPAPEPQPAVPATEAMPVAAPAPESQPAAETPAPEPAPTPAPAEPQPASNSTEQAAQ